MLQSPQSARLFLRTSRKLCRQRSLVRLAAACALSASCKSSYAVTYWLQEIGTLGGTNSTPHAMNVDGVVAGYSNVPLVDGDFSENYHAFRWTNGAMTDLGTLGGTLSVGNA